MLSGPHHHTTSNVIPGPFLLILLFLLYLNWALPLSGIFALSFFPPKDWKIFTLCNSLLAKHGAYFLTRDKHVWEINILQSLREEIQGPGMTLLVMKHVFVLLVHLLKSCLHKLRFRCFWVINHKDAATRCCEVERGIAKQASNKSELSATTMDVS